MNAPYGYCPHCFAPGESRERRPGGNDRCHDGHTYPSSSAIREPDFFRAKLEATQRERDRFRDAWAEAVVAAAVEASTAAVREERAAVVAYLKDLADAAGQRDAFWQGVASGIGYAAQWIERGAHRENKP